MTAPLDGLTPDYKLLAPEVEIIAKAIGGDKGKIDAVAASAGEWIKKDLSGANMNFLRNNSGLVGEIQGKITGVVGTELSTSLASAKYDWQKSYMVVQAGLKALGYKGRGGAELRLNGIFSEDMFIALLTYQLSSENYKKKDYGTGEKGEGSGVINSRTLNAMLDDLKTLGGGAKVTPAPAEVAKPAAAPAKEVLPVLPVKGVERSPSKKAEIVKVEGGYQVMIDGKNVNDIWDKVEETYDMAEMSAGGTIKVQKDGKWGLFGQDGDLHRYLEFDEIQPLADGRTLLKSEGKWGVGKINGRLILGLDYDTILVLPDGTYKVRQGNVWSVINPAETYEEVDDVDGGTIVKKGGRYGLIVGNKVLFQPEFDEIQEFGQFGDYIKFQQNGKMGLVFEGNIVLPAVTDQLEEVGDTVKWDIVKFHQNGKWGLVKGANVVFGPEYENIEEVGNHLKMQKDGKYRLLPESAEALIGPEGEDIKEVYDGRLAVKINGKWGLLSEDFSSILGKPEYEDLEYASYGIKFKKGGKWGLLGDHGEVIVEAKYEDIERHGDSTIAIKENGKWGLLSQDGKSLLISTKYDDLSRRRRVDGKIPFQQAGKWGLLSQTGEIFLPAEYEFKYIEELGEEFIFQVNGKSGLVLGNKVVLAAEYDEVIMSTNGYRFKKNGKWGLAIGNKILLPAEYSEIEVWGPGFRTFKNGKYGLVAGNQVLLTADYDKIDSISSYLNNQIFAPYSSGLKYAIKKDGKYGLLSPDEKSVLVEPKYDQLVVQDNGTIVFALNGMYGLLSADGRTTILGAKYSSVRVQEGGVIAVKESVETWGGIMSDDVWRVLSVDGKRVLAETEYPIRRVVPDGRIIFKNGYYSGLLSADGNATILEADYNSIDVAKDGRIVVQTDGGFGLLSVDGKMTVLEPKYQNIKVLSNGNLSVQLDGKRGLLSKDGKTVIIKPRYDYFEEQHNRIKLKLAGKYGLLSIDGSILLQPEYSGMIVYSDSVSVCKVDGGNRIGMKI